MPPKSKNQEDLIKRRLAQKICKRRRYAEIKNDPELSELEKRNRRERYQNKKKQEVKKKKSSRALKEQRKKWRENSKRCKIWIEACGRLDLVGKTSESLRHTHICSLHFQKQMYGKNSLKKTAIPVLLLPGKETRSIRTQTDPEIKDLFKVSKKQKLSDEKCKDITEKQILTGCDKFLSPQLGAIVKTSESSGVEQPSCSSFADSDMEEEHPEEKSEPPSPTTWLEIKQEVLWDGEQSSKEPGTAQAEQGAACGKEAAPPQVERGERGERSILEDLRREMGTVARRDEVSSGLEQIRQEIRELAQGDEFDAFGRYVASLLRNMRPRRASHAQPLLINLLAAEMMKQNDDDLA